MIHEGALALAVAILSPQFLTPDQAFRKLWGEMKRPRLGKELSDDEIQDMLQMKEAMTYKQIGEIFGMTADAVYNRIRRAQGRC